jgi:hypothetical protein
METQGLFSSRSTDRGSPSWHTDEAGGHGDKSQPRRSTARCSSGGDAHSGVFAGGARPVGARLPHPAGPIAQKAGTGRAAANRDLTERFLPPYTNRCMVQATEPGTAFIPWIGTYLAEMLWVQEARVVAEDNPVRYQGTSLQIQQGPHRFHDVKVTVRVHEYPDRTLALFHGPRCLARYDADGWLIDTGRAHPGPTLGSDVPPIFHLRPSIRARNNLGARLKYSKERTGQIMGYIHRTSELAIYRAFLIP